MLLVVACVVVRRLVLHRLSTRHVVGEVVFVVVCSAEHRNLNVISKLEQWQAIELVAGNLFFGRLGR